METTENISLLGLILTLTGFFAFMSIAFYVLFLSFKKRIEREQEALRNAEINFERQINEASMKAEQQERVQIAMDLHDEIGAMMTVLKINMINAKKRMDEPDHLHLVLNQTSETIEKTADAVRNISNRISPPALAKFGIQVTMNDLVGTINTTGKIFINFHSNLETMRFRLEAELNIYRILKELLNNILKHSHATKLDFEIQLKNEQFLVHFKYEGIGLNNAQVDHLLRLDKGNGLKSIQSRINNLRATISYEQPKNKLAEIHLKIPIHEIKN